MARPRAVTWFEPRWSSRARGVEPGRVWLFSRAEGGRLLAWGAAAFAIGSALAFLVFDAAFRDVFVVACAAFMAYAAALAGWVLVARFAIPWAHRVIPPWVRVTADHVDVVGPTSKRLRIPMTAVDSVVLSTTHPSRRTLTIRWNGGETTLGLRPGVRAEDLRALVGRTWITAPDAGTS